MGTKTTGKQIELLKTHTHAGRDYEPGAKFPVSTKEAPSDSPIAIDHDSAEWLVSIETAKYID